MTKLITIQDTENLNYHSTIIIISGKRWRLSTFSLNATFKLKTVAIFFIWKLLRVLQKARIKIVARAIYTCLFFSYIYSPFLLENKSLPSKLDHNYSSIIYESKYFRVDQVKFV